MRKYCADLVGLLADSQVILLEVKQLDCERGVLPEFNQRQHDEYVVLERIGVPIGYAYNAVDRLAYESPQPPDWAAQTLGQINRAAPTQLPSARPRVNRHISLLDWLREAQGHGALGEFGRIHGAFKAAPDLRNGALVLLYGVSSERLAILSPDDVENIVHMLTVNPRLNASHRAALSSILGESADVFEVFEQLAPRGDDNSSHRSDSPPIGG